MKDKGRLRKHNRLEKTKETMTKCNMEPETGTKKNIKEKISES